MSDPARTTLTEFAAEPERVADAAFASPLRIEREGGADLVLLSAEAFERLRRDLPQAMDVSELSDRDVERMLAREVPEEAARHDHEGGFVGRG